MSRTEPWNLPPYPYDELNRLKVHGEAFDGGLLNLSIGAPGDGPPSVALDAMVGTGSERSYPPSIGTEQARGAARAWMARRLGVDVGDDALAVTIGSKEFVASTPAHLHLRRPDLDTVLFPSISYPSYRLGAEMAGLRAVPVAVRNDWSIDVDSIDDGDAARALCLWVNTPGNPAGGLDDLDAVAAWAAEQDVTVLSDECYVEFTWRRSNSESAGLDVERGRTILEHTHKNVLAVHSLSKRSNFAGARFGFYAGDPELVHWLSEVRKHSGAMVPGPVQAAAAAALADDEHVAEQRERYFRRLAFMVDLLVDAGLDVDMPSGGFYLWASAAGIDDWELVSRFAERVGVLVSPGTFYGPQGRGHVRIALVEPLSRLEVVAERLAGGSGLFD